MVTINSFNTGTGVVSVKVTTHPRKISFKQQNYNITVAGKTIVDKYSESLLRGLKYRYRTRANFGGKNITKQFKKLPAEKKSRYGYVGGIILNKNASRWFGHIEAGRAPKKRIPLDYFRQHQENPGQKGTPINYKMNNERIPFVKVKPNLQLKNLFQDTVNKKYADFARTLVRLQKQALKKR